MLGEPVEANGLDRALDRLAELDPLLAAFVAEPMLRVTLTPTKARASEKENVIPSRAEILVDCRVPPGLEEPEVRERVEGLLAGSGEFEVGFTEHVVGNRSPTGTPLADAIAETMDELDPGAALVPIVMPGFSDSHWFRKAFGAATVYGFCPQREMSLAEAGPLVHAADERIYAADVGLAAEFYLRVCRRLLG